MPKCVLKLLKRNLFPNQNYINPGGETIQNAFLNKGVLTILGGGDVVANKFRRGQIFAPEKFGEFS